MELLDINYENRKLKIKDCKNGFLINSWDRFEWLNNPEKIPHIVDNIVTAFENPYEYIHKNGNIESFKNNKVTYKNTKISKDNYALHTESNNKHIKIFDLTCDESVQFNRKQKIKEWTKQQWVSAPFIGRIIIQSVIISYKEPKKYINNIIKGEDNNYYKLKINS